MKKRVISIILLVLTLLLAVITTACSADHSKTTEPQQHGKLKAWEIPPTIILTDEALEWREDFLYEYYMAYPYVSIVPFTEEMQAELDAVPAKFEEYKKNFHVEIKNPSDLTNLLLTAAISDSAYDRLDAANHAECPDELLLYIAMNEPDRVVRFRALGNILARDDFPVEYLEEMATCENDYTRWASMLHNNRSLKVIELLMNDPVELIANEVNFAIGEAI